MRGGEARLSAGKAGAGRRGTNAPGCCGGGGSPGPSRTAERRTGDEDAVSDQAARSGTAGRCAGRLRFDRGHAWNRAVGSRSITKCTKRLQRRQTPSKSSTAWPAEGIVSRAEAVGSDMCQLEEPRQHHLRSAPPHQTLPVAKATGHTCQSDETLGMWLCSPKVYPLPTSRTPRVRAVACCGWLTVTAAATKRASA